MVKKTEFGLYNTPIKADGIIAINIRDDDELVAVRRVDPGEEILMVSHAGLTVRFREEDARAMGRYTSGVRGMDVSGEDNYVIAMDVARPGQDLLVVTENGYGKRTLDRRVPADVARRQGRQDDHASPRRRACSPARSSCASTRSCVFISQNGMVQRTSVRGINRYGRASQGVRVMNLRDGRRRLGRRAGGRERGAPSRTRPPATRRCRSTPPASPTSPALEGEGVIVGDPDEEGLLDVPEVESDDMPDSDARAT